MTEPITVVWNVGVNAHGQPISVTQYRHNGRKLYRIDRGQADQRDDVQWLGGLTEQNIKDIASILK